MSLTISLNLKNIKNIQSFDFAFNFENGIYALVGNNSVGKSTLMTALASTVFPRTLLKYSGTEVCSASSISINCKNTDMIWTYNETTDKVSSNKVGSLFDGIYEGSVFSGTRFEDMTNIDGRLNDTDFTDTFVKASDELMKALGQILHENPQHYSELYKLNNMISVRNFGLINMPYFLRLPDGKFISKFKMSSGECMLISLLNFIISSAYRSDSRSRRRGFLDTRRFIFIDEVELALHPSSIDRLIIYLEDMIQKSNAEITVLFSTHSSELIRRMTPRNIFLLKNNNGQAAIITPCFPQYAIRSLYSHDGYDCTVLVEDRVSEMIVKKLIMKYRTDNNLMINVVPAGSWANILELQKNIAEQNAFGRDKFVFSIIDGDVEAQVNKNKSYVALRKLFLPIKSLEKYLYQKLIIAPDDSFIRFLGNKYFTLDPLESIVAGIKSDSSITIDKTGKNLYGILLKELAKIKMTEDEFLREFSSDLFDRENFQSLQIKIEKFITDNFHIKKNR